MHVRAERRGDISVSHILAHDLKRIAELNRHGCEAVAYVVNADALHAGKPDQSIEVPVKVIRVDGAAK
jgi:hypothetical protein